MELDRGKVRAKKKKKSRKEKKPKDSPALALGTGEVNGEDDCGAPAAGGLGAKVLQIPNEYNMPMVGVEIEGLNGKKEKKKSKKRKRWQDSSQSAADEVDLTQKSVKQYGVSEMMNNDGGDLVEDKTPRTKKKKAGKQRARSRSIKALATKQDNPDTGAHSPLVDNGGNGVCEENSEQGVDATGSESEIPTNRSSDEEKARQKTCGEDKALTEWEDYLTDIREIIGDEPEELARPIGSINWQDSRQEEVKKTLRYGPFAPQEDEMVRKIVEDFGRREGLSLKNMEEWIFPKRFKRDKLQRTVWKELHLALNRPLQTIYDRCQRLFLGPLCRQGPWSKEDCSRLLDLHKAYGPKWRLIGDELQRLDRDCLLKFMTLTKTKRGSWKVEEAEKLGEVVQGFLQQRKQSSSEKHVDISMTNIQDLPWQKISMQMGGREKGECMRFWHNYLCPSMIARSEWSFEDDCVLLKVIWTSGARFAHELAWEALVPGRSEAKTRERWISLRRTVYKGKNLALLEVVKVLIDRNYPEIWEEVPVRPPRQLRDLRIINPVYRTFLAMKTPR